MTAPRKPILTDEEIISGVEGSHLVDRIKAKIEELRTELEG